MTTFAQMGFAASVTASSATPQTDGYIGGFRGHPYHIHPTATAAQWAALQAAIADGTVTVSAYVAPAAPSPTLHGRLAELARLSTEREAAGILYTPVSAPAPVLIQTDPASQARIDGYVTQIMTGAFPPIGVTWKLSPGVFVVLHEADIYPIKRLVAAYIAACLANEAALSAALASNLQTDLTAGWPSNG